MDISNPSKCKIQQEVTGPLLNHKKTKGESSFESLSTKDKITTSSKYLDDLLGGGIPLKKITEICANSGCGKSKLCFQLAINVQLPGLDGECIYIDTEGSFYHRSEKIHLFRVLSHAELLALIHQLKDILTTYPKVKLIVVDSIAYHFRLNTLEPGKRPVLLKWIAQTLNRFAEERNIAVIMTNHVTRESEDGPWIPSLGPHWGQLCSNRLFLYHHQGALFGHLYKSQYEKVDKTVQFCITDSGISDPSYDQLVDFKAIEQHEIDRKMKEAWEEIVEKQRKDDDDDEQLIQQNPELDSVWDEEHISDQILYEIPSQTIVYEYDGDDDEDLNNISTIIENNNVDEERSNCIPPLSSSPPTTLTIDDTFSTLLDDGISFIEYDDDDEKPNFENDIPLKRKRSKDYLITCNEKNDGFPQYVYKRK